MKITVIGAYGYTGLLICNELEKRKISFAVAGRNNTLLNSLKEKFSMLTQTICVDINTNNGVAEVLLGSDLLINCAGPYNEESSKLTIAVAEQGKIYLDLCGELDFVKNSAAKNNVLAAASGATLIHACAFESLPGDLIINLLLEQIATITDLRFFYSFTHSRPSPGTKLTMKLARFRQALKISNGNWQVFDYAKDKLTVKWAQHPQLNMAVPYPLPEIAFSEWICKPQESASYLLLSKEDAAFINPLSEGGPTKEEVIATHKKREVLGPQQTERQLQEFTLTICANYKNDKKKCYSLSGNDMYLCTAQAIALTVEEIISSKKIPKGVIRPSALFVGKEKECLKQLGLELNLTNEFYFNE